ncbi:hypothetical protein [Shimazuella kribbensis]|uniref:hypothetical protein n=1 Tax=Shimazuella kribbensis TaxID=139808 RepID=UPI00048EB9E2|nr:hypothetical protein [Shimazuella kribbensis]
MTVVTIEEIEKLNSAMQRGNDNDNVDVRAAELVAQLLVELAPKAGLWTNDFRVLYSSLLTRCEQVDLGVSDAACVTAGDIDWFSGLMDDLMFVANYDHGEAFLTQMAYATKANHGAVNVTVFRVITRSLPGLWVWIDRD